MTDDYTHALEQENERLLAEAEQLRKDIQASERRKEFAYKESSGAQDQAIGLLERVRSLESLLSEEKAARERAEADNTALRKVISAVAVDAPGRVARVLEEHKPIITVEHPGAALLGERRRIAKTLDAMDVPSEADEAEKWRTFDLAGRVDLLASWGQRGWRECRKAKDSEAALLERLRAAEVTN